MRAFLALLLVAALCCCAVLSVDARTHKHHRATHKNVEAITYTPAALADQIHNLPGLEVAPGFNMFSGYLTVDAARNRSIFYWYVESSKLPATSAPLIWWSNGGPGCSGMLGFLTEHGPFRVAAAPATGLVPFEYAWNRLANVLYVEAPAGVGYSFSNDASDYITGDSKTANDNLLAIQQFFERFPEQRANDFYISAESYGGHYVPTLTAAIVSSKSLSNFKGFLLGNPLTDMDENSNWGQAGTMCGHSLASSPTCASFRQHCLGAGGADSLCSAAQNAVIWEAGGLDAYGLDFPTCPQSAQAKTMLHTLFQARRSASAADQALPAHEAQLLQSLGNPAYDPCEQAEETVYLNRADVRAALHVAPQAGAWAACTQRVSYNRSDVTTPMEPIYTQLLASGANLRMLIFSGDDDSVCASLGTQHWMFGGLLGTPVSQWQQWRYDSSDHGSQVGGYLTQFKGISFATVHGAGHMVSGYQPEKGLAVLENFLAGKFTDKAEAAMHGRV